MPQSPVPMQHMVALGRPLARRQNRCIVRPHSHGAFFHSTHLLISFFWHFQALHASNLAALFIPVINVHFSLPKQP